MRASAGLVLAALLLAGCGGGAKNSAPPTTGPTGSPKELFVQQCGSCHKLRDAGTQGIVGKDLDEVQPTRAAVLKAIQDGPQNMPPDLVTGPYAHGVAAYVASVAGK